MCLVAIIVVTSENITQAEATNAKTDYFDEFHHRKHLHHPPFIAPRKRATIGGTQCPPKGRANRPPSFESQAFIDDTLKIIISQVEQEDKINRTCVLIF